MFHGTANSGYDCTRFQCRTAQIMGKNLGSTEDLPNIDTLVKFIELLFNLDKRKKSVLERNSTQVAVSIVTTTSINKKTRSIVTAHLLLTAGVMPYARMGSTHCTSARHSQLAH